MINSVRAHITIRKPITNPPEPLLETIIVTTEVHFWSNDEALEFERRVREILNG